MAWHPSSRLNGRVLSAWKTFRSVRRPELQSAAISFATRVSYSTFSSNARGLGRSVLSAMTLFTRKTYEECDLSRQTLVSFR